MRKTVTAQKLKEAKLIALDSVVFILADVFPYRHFVMGTKIAPTILMKKVAVTPSQVRCLVF